MLTALTRRIQEICGNELALPRQQVLALARRNTTHGPLEAAISVMARRPSLLSPGVTVDIVCFTMDHFRLTMSVTMRAHPRQPLGDVFWQEAEAWAHALADNAAVTIEPRGVIHNGGGKIFQYGLKERDLNGRSTDEAPTAPGTSRVIRHAPSAAEPVPHPPHQSQRPSHPSRSSPFSSGVTPTFTVLGHEQALALAGQIRQVNTP